jgi:hypothetical protein
MAESDLGGRSNRWPYHSAHFWCGLVAGVGVGLLLGAALVEIGALATERKAWVSLVGALLVGAGGFVGWRGQPGNRIGTEPSATPDRGGMSSPRGS